MTQGPLVALAFKLEEGRFGQLTYMRVYSGTVRKGDPIVNSTTGKRIKVSCKHDIEKLPAALNQYFTRDNKGLAGCKRSIKKLLFFFFFVAVTLQSPACKARVISGKVLVQCCDTHVTALRLYTYVPISLRVMCRCHDCAVCVQNLHVCKFDPLHQQAPSQAVKLAIFVPKPSLLIDKPW